MTVVRRAVVFNRLLDRIQSHPNGPVADGVKVRLHALGVQRQNPRRQFIGWQDQHAGAPALAQVRLQQRRSLAFEHPVNKELGCIPAQALAAVAVLRTNQPLGRRPSQRARHRDRQHHPRGEATCRLKPLPSRPLVRGGGRVNQGGDAKLVGKDDRLTGGFQAVRSGKRRDNCLDQTLGGFPQRTGGHVIGVALDDPIERIGGLRLNARQFQRLGIGPGRVAVRAAQKDGAVRVDRIEQVLGRIGIRKQRQVPATAHQPFSFRQRRIALRHLGEQSRRVGRAGQVALHELDATESRMHVGVVKSGQDHAPAEFEDLAPKAAEHFCVTANRGYATPANCHGLGPRHGLIHGVHPACAQNQVGGLRRLAATGQQRRDGQQSEWNAHDEPL